MSERTFVIVGASLAGAKAAAELRERGFDGRVVLIGSEPELPYERPPLSKDYLRGESEREKAYVHEHGFYEQHEIELRDRHDGRRRSTRRRARQARRRPRARLRPAAADDRAPSRGGCRCPGAELDGIHYLRTIADCDAIRERLGRRRSCRGRRRGWIGCEVAACARQRGLEVTVVDPLALPTSGSSARRSARSTATCTPGTVSSCVLGDGVAAFEGDGAVARVRTSGGAALECDFVGGRRRGHSPRRARQRGRARDRQRGPGRREACRAQRRTCSPPATSPMRGIRSTSERIRVEHWANALNQGPAAARAMLGDRSATTGCPTSSQTSTTSAWSTPGTPPSGTRSCSAASRAAGEFIAFWLRDGRVIAG